MNQPTKKMASNLSQPPELVHNFHQASPFLPNLGGIKYDKIIVASFRGASFLFQFQATKSFSTARFSLLEA